MKIVCSKANLAKGVSTVSKAVPSKTTMPILECVLIDATLDVIKLTANDMELGIQTEVEGEIIEHGMIAIDARIFSEIVRKLPDNDVIIETDENLQATITCEKANFNISCKPGDEFSYLPIIEKDTTISISQYTLKEVIRQTIFSIADNESNKVMTGELFEINQNTLRVVSLDGHRISIRKLELKEEYDHKKIIVPGKTLIEISKILSGEADGATGYDYVISKANDTTTARVDVTKNQVKTTGDFNYVQQGTYYAYCHAWRRNAEGKKVFGEWSNIYPFSVSAITPAQPVITSVKAKGTTVTVTYTKAANAEGYDVVLGSAAKKVNGEYRPVSYGKLVKKNIKGNVVTATFKNVKKGTYYAGLHAFNKTSEDGKKVFSQWSNVKKVTVK